MRKEFFERINKIEKLYKGKKEKKLDQNKKEKLQQTTQKFKILYDVTKIIFMIKLYKLEVTILRIM